MRIVAHPLNSQRWPDLEALFNAKGCSFARGCWCMFYRESGKTNVSEGVRLPITVARNSRHLRTVSRRLASSPTETMRQSDGYRSRRDQSTPSSNDPPS
jgi:hypothetical protein